MLRLGLAFYRQTLEMVGNQIMVEAVLESFIHVLCNEEKSGVCILKFDCGLQCGDKRIRIMKRKLK